MSRRLKVLLAMSGGVDSSVAAALLSEQGYDLIGITIKTYNLEEVGGSAADEASCSPPDGAGDARAVAAMFGFPHHVLDLSERFGAEVIEDFIREYLVGRTPNPCVLCNPRIKWGELIRKADELGADMIATGHYARVRQEDGRSILSRGADPSKDQSYVLWGLPQASLKRTLFPLGELTKGEVRARAERLGLPNARKAESFEICFIPDNNYERFLKEKRRDLEKRLGGGEMIMDGEVVGTHRGYPFYTIGQRKGLGLAAGKPVYVTRIDPERNRLEIGPESMLFHSLLTARQVNMVKYDDCRQGRRVTGQIRSMDPGSPGLAETLADGRLQVRFDQRRKAITPGQSVVVYEGNDVVGGGIIDEVSG
jgi:tRNA-specific 2-thiouridylase